MNTVREQVRVTPEACNYAEFVFVISWLKSTYLTWWWSLMTPLVVPVALTLTLGLRRTPFVQGVHHTFRSMWLAVRCCLAVHHNIARLFRARVV